MTQSPLRSEGSVVFLRLQATSPPLHAATIGCTPTKPASATAAASDASGCCAPPLSRRPLPLPIHPSQQPHVRRRRPRNGVQAPPLLPRRPPSLPRNLALPLSLPPSLSPSFAPSDCITPAFPNWTATNLTFGWIVPCYVPVNPSR